MTIRGQAPYRSRNASSYSLIGGQDFTGVASGSLGIAPGAKTVGGIAYTLANNGSAFLRADPNGIYTTQGTGLWFDSTGGSTSVDNWTGSQTLGPVLYAPVSSLVPAAKWSATTFGLAGLYAFLDFVFIVDASQANAAGEYVVCGVAGVNFTVGGTGRSGFNSTYAVGSSSVVASFVSSGAISVGSINAAWVGMSPTAIRVRVTPCGCEVYWGFASGLTPPTAWRTRDVCSVETVLNSPASLGTFLTTDLVVGLGLTATSTAVAVNVKRILVYGQRHPRGMTQTVIA